MKREMRYRNKIGDAGWKGTNHRIPSPQGAAVMIFLSSGVWDLFKPSFRKWRHRDRLMVSL